MRLPAALVLSMVLAGCAATPPPDPGAEPIPAPTSIVRAWEARAAAPMILAETAVASEGPMIYVVGGWTEAGGGSPFVVSYDAMNDTWAQLPQYPLPVHHAQAAAIDGTLYVFGGAVTTAVLPGSLVGVGPFGWPRTPLSFKLAPGATTWEPIADMPEARALGGAAVVDGRVYLVGGIGLEGYLSVVHVYDPATDSYQEAPPIPTTRDHLSVVAHEARIYAIAGRSNEGGAWDDLEANEVLDVANGTWTALADAPLGRGGQGAGILRGGQIALVGGERAEGEFTVYDDAHAYDIATDTWVEIPRLPEPLHGMPAASWDGSLFLFGGATAQEIRSASWALAPQED